MEERNLVTCKACNLQKVRITAGKFDQRNKKYVDEDGRYWNGRTCGACNAIRVRLKMQSKRAAEKLSVTLTETSLSHT